MKNEKNTGTAPAKNNQENCTFCKHISAIMVRGIVRLSASVPIKDEVRKQPHNHSNSERTVPIRPLITMHINTNLLGNSKASNPV